MSKDNFYCLIIQNIADISNKLIILLRFKFMKNVNLKPSQEYTHLSIKYNTILLKNKSF